MSSFRSIITLSLGHSVQLVLLSELLVDHVVVLGALVRGGLLVLAAAELVLGDRLLLVLLEAEVLLVCGGLVR